MEISNEHRKLHGALLDAELLTEVYLKMTHEQSPYIDDAEIGKLPRPPVALISGRKPGPIISLSADDKQAHEAYIDDLEKANKKTSVWRSGAASAAKAPAP